MKIENKKHSKIMCSGSHSALSSLIWFYNYLKSELKKWTSHGYALWKSNRHFVDAEVEFHSLQRLVCGNAGSGCQYQRCCHGSVFIVTSIEVCVFLAEYFFHEGNKYANLVQQQFIKKFQKHLYSIITSS